MVNSKQMKTPWRSRRQIRQQYMPDGRREQRTAPREHTIPVTVQNAKHARRIITVRVVNSQPTVVSQKACMHALPRDCLQPAQQQLQIAIKQNWNITRHMATAHRHAVIIQMTAHIQPNVQIA